MISLKNIFKPKKGEMNPVDKAFDIDKIAAFLKTTPKALAEFEKSYGSLVSSEPVSDNLFKVNAKQATEGNEGTLSYNAELADITSKILDELIDETPVCIYDDNGLHIRLAEEKYKEPLVTPGMVTRIPEAIRPELTGYYAKVDIKDPSYIALADTYRRYLAEPDSKKKQYLYHHFRQGLDILDIDPVTYEIIGMNMNSMGNWFPQITKAAEAGSFFKIPHTRIIKIPVTMLQLTRQDYMSLTRTTLDIVDDFCRKVFDLDVTKKYFIKTGTYSSKYDFRNACVSGAKEVRELGEYLLFIHFQACMMASPLSQPCIYGAGTTNEWVVREFIEDKEDNPCIYKGLPLHTEYRVFVDFDTKEILGINPYWDPDVMKQKFKSGSASNPHDMHDYVTYAAHEEKLMNRYSQNKDIVLKNIQQLLNDMSDVDIDGIQIPALTGQWAIDIMQNGDDFWLIDMSLAQNSALSKCIPTGKLKPLCENWIPELKKEV